jgi:hypothetical protein
MMGVLYAFFMAEAHEIIGSKFDEVPTQLVRSLTDATSSVLKETWASLESIGDFAKGLSISIPNIETLKEYQNILGKQEEATQILMSTANKFKVDIESIKPFLENNIVPMSNALADIGLASANAARLYGEGVINKHQLESTQNFAGLTLGTLEDQQRLMSGYLKSVPGQEMFDFGTNALQSLQLVGEGVTEMIRAIPSFPIGQEHFFAHLGLRTKIDPFQEDQIESHQKKLDELLIDIDPMLIEYRKGVWVAFKEKHEDYVGQATSSMRRLVDELLRKLAPQSEVAKTEYFQKSPEARSKNNSPTRKAKIYYIMNWDEKKEEHLQRLARGFLEAYDNLSAWDHRPINKDSFVHGVFITLEGYLLSFLAEHKGE